MNYGNTQINLEKILEEKNISKNQMSRDLLIDRTVITNYCKNRMKRLDISLLNKFCYYLDVDYSELLTYTAPNKDDE